MKKCDYNNYLWYDKLIEPTFPGADFAIVKGDGNGAYTFHKTVEETPELVIKRGGLYADYLIDEWFDYEYKNRKCNEAYELTKKHAELVCWKWDKKWEDEGLQPVCQKAS